MKIIFLNTEEDKGGYWWSPYFKYNFEIEYDTEKNFEIYAKELRLNLKYQFYHSRIWRTHKR